MDAAGVAAASLGEKKVVLVSKEGLVVARGQVSVQPRPAAVERSARYDYRVSKKAAVRLQAIFRGKAERRKALTKPTQASAGRDANTKTVLNAGRGRPSPSSSSSAGPRSPSKRS